MNLYQKVMEIFRNSKYQNSLKTLREERGAIFVLTAFLLPLLLGCLGFAYDAGNLYMHKARLQNTADAAALAGARAFVDEAASQRKTLRTQYMNNNNVTTIPTDVSNEINDTVKTEAKTAAKNAAVANVTKNMVNLHNDYQSKYYLVTGRITESGKNYEQQYFKANLEETVPLYFIPILLNKREQDVAAEAISTIINKGTGKASNKKEKFGPDSLFMTKHGFANLGDTFYNDGAGNTSDPPKAPTWTDDYFEGNLRYTEDDFVADFGNSTKVNNYAGGVPFEGVFNKKATELMTKLKKLMNSYNAADYNAFIDEMKTHSDFYSVNDNAFTAKGNVLYQKTKDLLPESGIQYDKAFWGVYNAFYDELVSNSNYFRTFQKLEGYNIDKFGDAVKALFKRKLVAEQGISEDTYRAKYQEDHDAWVATTSDGGQWKTEHDNWQRDYNTWKDAETAAIAAAQARIDEMVANGGGSSAVIDPYNCTPQQAYEILKKYKDMYPAKAAIINGRSGNDYAWDEYNNSGDNQYFKITNNFSGIVYNINYNDSYVNWENVPNDGWMWQVIRQGYESYKADGGADNLTPKDAYDKLAVYKDFLNQSTDNLCTLLVMREYVKDGNPYGIINNIGNFESLVKNMPALNNDSLTWSMIDYQNSDFQQLNLGGDANWWVNLKTLYVQGNGNLNPSSSGIPTLSQLMAPWYADPANAEPEEPPKPREPQLEDYIRSTNGDEYYAQYHGSEQNWTASAISSQQNSKEHSYFYYPAPINFTLTIDAAGFYTDENVTAEDPFYLFIGDNFQGDVINIILDADVNRPLIFCYMGTKNIKIHIELQGHTFQGIIYTPHAHGSEVFMNTNSSSGTKGTFKGTWMSDTITLKQNSSHYEYEEFYLDSSLKSAMPNFTGEIQEGDDEFGDDEDLSDKNPIKVIKLVKSVADILSVEEIN